MIRQLSVFIENKQGSLANTAEILAKNNINIRAMSLADTDKYGVLRMIVDNLDAAQKALGEAGYLTRANDVVAVLMPDTAGALHDVIALLDEVGVNVEYLYAFMTRTEKHAYVVIRVEDNDAAEKALLAAGFHLITEADVDKL